MLIGCKIYYQIAFGCESGCGCSLVVNRYLVITFSFLSILNYAICIIILISIFYSDLLWIISKLLSIF